MMLKVEVVKVDEVLDKESSLLPFSNSNFKDGAVVIWRLDIRGFLFCDSLIRICMLS